MPMRLHPLPTTLLIMAISCLLMAASCSSLRNQDPTLNFAISIGVMKAVESVPQEDRLQRATRIVELADLALDMLDDEDAVIAKVYERVLGEINWEKMEVSDQLLLRQLISHVAASVEERIKNRTVNGDRVTAITTAVEWVREAAETYRQSLENG